MINSPGQHGSNSDPPTAITNVLLATSGWSSRTGDIPLASPTCSSRTCRGRWALDPNGEEVIVLWPGGALAGPPSEVAGELDRLGDDQNDLDHAAVWAIRQFLTDPAAQDGARRSSTRARTWSSPATSYWLSSPANHHSDGAHTPASRPGVPARPPHPPNTLPDSSAQSTPARAA